MKTFPVLLAIIALTWADVSHLTHQYMATNRLLSNMGQIETTIEKHELIELPTQIEIIKAGQPIYGISNAMPNTKLDEMSNYVLPAQNIKPPSNELPFELSMISSYLTPESTTTKMPTTTNGMLTTSTEISETTTTFSPEQTTITEPTTTEIVMSNSTPTNQYLPPSPTSMITTNEYLPPVTSETQQNTISIATQSQQLTTQFILPDSPAAQSNENFPSIELEDLNIQNHLYLTPKTKPAHDYLPPTTTPETQYLPPVDVMMPPPVPMPQPTYQQYIEQLQREHQQMFPGDQLNDIQATTASLPMQPVVPVEPAHSYSANGYHYKAVGQDNLKSFLYRH